MGFFKDIEKGVKHTVSDVQKGTTHTLDDLGLTNALNFSLDSLSHWGSVTTSFFTDTRGSTSRAYHYAYTHSKKGVTHTVADVTDEIAVPINDTAKAIDVAARQTDQNTKTITRDIDKETKRATTTTKENLDVLAGDLKELGSVAADTMGLGSSEQLVEPERLGVNKRHYGEIADNGIQSQAEYDAYIEGDYSNLKYLKHWDRYTLQNGVDLEAALEDWSNYMDERSEIALYRYNEERNKLKPATINTSKAVEYEITKQDTPKVTQRKSTSLIGNYEDPGISVYQSLGIY